MTQMSIFVFFFKCWSLILGCFFPVSILNVYFNDMQKNRWQNFKDVKDTFFSLNLQKTATEICRLSLLKIFFISLDKSVLLHRRCLMSKFPEILILMCRKIFYVFYMILHETFSNNCGFTLL